MKLKQMVQGLLYISALAGAAQVMAADLNVAGRIQPSGACSLALGNGGTVDLGTISSRRLKDDRPTFIGRPFLSLAIDCQTPSRIAIRAIDNRANTADREGRYGLGAIRGNNTGSYLWAPMSRLGDGKPLVQVYYRNGAWQSSDSVSVAAYMYPDELSSWAEPGDDATITPQAFKNIASSIYINVEVAPASELDLSQEIAIDGSATMELVYL
ncbi:DUF1120 domain-containing protein [Pseudomonas aeruginosa]